MKDNIKPEDLHAVNTKSFGDTQTKGEASMKQFYRTSILDIKLIEWLSSPPINTLSGF